MVGKSRYFQHSNPSLVMNCMLPTCIHVTKTVNILCKYSKRYVHLEKTNFLWATGRVSQYKNGEYLFLLHEKSHFFREIEKNSQYFMISAVKSASHLFGPYIFDSPLNQTYYLRMLGKHLS
jgi:hypothetical protein